MDFSRSWRGKSSSPFFKYSSLIKPSASQRDLHRRRQNITNYEPASPIVSCMGRIKRSKIPPPPPPPPPSRRRGFHMFSVSRVSSYNQYNPNTKRSACAFSAPNNCLRGCSRAICEPKKEILKVEEMDPPLPVERRMGKLCFVESLWRRRCRDKGDLAELKLCRPARLPVIESNFGMAA